MCERNLAFHETDPLGHMCLVTFLTPSHPSLVKMFGGKNCIPFLISPKNSLYCS